MRLKLYRAPGIAEAMARIRAELGPDALILGTRRVAEGIEVTAALETDPPSPQREGAQPRPAAPPVRTDERREAALAWHGVPAAQARRLVAGALPFALSVAYRFAAVDFTAGAGPTIFVGPPGAGKTLTVARLATRLVLSGRQPVVVTADGKRAGATEQLAAFTRLLGLNLLAASTPAALARALAHRVDGAPMLIDAPGLDLFDRTQAEELAAMTAAVGGVPALVLPAGLDPMEAAEMAAAYRERGAVILIATRLDVARRLGSTLAAAGSGLALAEAGIGPGAADGLTPMTPDLLAARLLQVPERRP